MPTQLCCAKCQTDKMLADFSRVQQRRGSEAVCKACALAHRQRRVAPGEAHDLPVYSGRAFDSKVVSSYPIPEHTPRPRPIPNWRSLYRPSIEAFTRRDGTVVHSRLSALLDEVES